MVRLEPFTDEHLPSLRDLVTDPDVIRYSRVPEPVPVDFEQTWAALYDVGRADGTRMNFAIALDGEFAGVALAPHLSAAAATGELGYLVAPWARGRGVATEALRLLTDWAFTERSLVRLELYIDVANEASRRVAQRSGYTCEGVLRSLHLKQAKRVDTELWSRLVTDPQP
jgi:RimJ/RimL family protein N-acetyltransferase